MAGGLRRSWMINDGHKYIVGRGGQGGQSRVLAYLGLSIDLGF